MSEPRFTVLLVDDSPFFLTIESQFLRRLPVRILEARSAQDATTLCRDASPDLVYMAYQLQDQSGADCCRQLKTDAELRDIPLVMVCDERSHEQLEACRRAGCDGVVTRPLDRRRFLEICHNFLPGLGEPRRRCHIKVQIRAGDRQFEAKGVDISSGGLFVESSEDLAPGTFLDLELHLARAGEEGPIIHCRGVIGWLNTRETPPKPYYPIGFGVRFVEVPTAAGPVLARFLRTLVRQ